MATHHTWSLGLIVVLEIKNHIWEVDHKNYLGFFCLNTFELPNPDLTFEQLLNVGILHDWQLGDLTQERKELGYYGPLSLNQLTSEDFTSANDTNELQALFHDYWNDADWGEDLPLFKKNYESAIKQLEQLDLASSNFFFLNSERMNDSKLEDPNFFIYFVLTIGINIKKQTAFTLTFGLD